ncbi:MAG: sulfotransferase family 2 domain-containing protein [Elainellaceae cyanobacterium]
MKSSALEYRLQPHDLLYFLHIPKTAGTTLYHLLDGKFELDDICPARFWSELLDLSPESRNNYRFFRGHFGYPIHWVLDKKPVYITVLRNPIDRVISYYESVCRHPYDFFHQFVASQTMSLADFIRSPDTRCTVANLQTRSLVMDMDVRSPHIRARNRHATTPCGLDGITEMTLLEMPDDELLAIAKQRLDEFAFVGLVEHFQDSMLLLSYIFGWYPFEPVERLNQAPQRRRPDVSPDVLDEARELNRLDIELYDYATHLFKRSFQQMVQTLISDSSHPRDLTGEIANHNEGFAHADGLIPSLIQHYERRFVEDTPPQMSVDFVASQPIHGHGWHQREGDNQHVIAFRWTGPTPISTLDFRLQNAAPFIVRFWMINSVLPDPLESLEISANNQRLFLRAILVRETLTILQSSIQANQFDDTRDFIRLTFKVPETRTLQSIDSNNLDTRQVGVALHRVQIFPDVPQSEDKQCTSFLLPFPDHDLGWIEAAEFVKQHIKSQERIIAPGEFIRIFPQQFQAEGDRLVDRPPIDWVLFHKENLQMTDLNQLAWLMKAFKPVFANPVFIIFSKRTDLNSLGYLSTHVRAFTKTMIIKRLKTLTIALRAQICV